MPAKAKSHFTPALFSFLRDLAANNDREWFQANKERYEDHVKAPILTFITDLSAGLKKIAPSFIADPRPVGGSMFRLHRDVRFAKDKSPYKTHIGAQFRHVASEKDVHAPGFYLHLAPKESMGGGGLWHPEPEPLAQVRDRIVARPKEWQKAKQGLEVLGDALKRPPAGYDADHPYIEDLKHKDFYCMSRFSDRDVCAPGFLDTFLEACRTSRPLITFLTAALGLKL